MNDPNPPVPASVGVPDAATVTPAGEPLAKGIEGVVLGRTPSHVDHRGRVFEVFNPEHDFWEVPIVHSYVFTIRPGVIKGWGIHEHKEDRYCLVAGEVLVVMYDGRADSPTVGRVQEVALTAQGVRMIRIPRGVWHIDINLGGEEGVVLNQPTSPYNYERPDRRTLPWNSPEIPVDITRYLPQQWR